MSVPAVAENSGPVDPQVQINREPVEGPIPIERDIRELRRHGNKCIKEFLALIENFSEEDEFVQIDNHYKEVIGHVDNLQSKLELIIAGFENVNNADKADDYSEKLSCLETQYVLLQNAYRDAAEKHHKRLKNLETSLKATSTKNTTVTSHSSKSKRSSTVKPSRYFGSLFSEKGMSLKQKAIIAESQLKMAKVKADLYKQLLESKNDLPQTSGTNATCKPTPKMDSNTDDEADVQVDTLKMKKVAVSCDTVHDVDDCCANDTSNCHNVVNNACENFHDNVDAGSTTNGEEVIKIATKKCDKES